MTDQISRQSGYDADSEMSLVGYVIAAGVGFILLPVLPFIAVLWLVAELSGDDRTRPRPT